jgi:hypothetical protein
VCATYFYLEAALSGRTQGFIIHTQKSAEFAFFFAGTYTSFFFDIFTEEKAHWLELGRQEKRKGEYWLWWSSSYLVAAQGLGAHAGDPLLTMSNMSAWLTESEGLGGWPTDESQTLTGPCPYLPTLLCANKHTFSGLSSSSSQLLLLRWSTERLDFLTGRACAYVEPTIFVSEK